MTLFTLFLSVFFFFFNDTATTEIYTLSLHDALPISELYELDVQCNEPCQLVDGKKLVHGAPVTQRAIFLSPGQHDRSEEHTSELQSRLHLVCRLLLEKKKKKQKHTTQTTTRQDNSYQ